jgi:hypothetical protein
MRRVLVLFHSIVLVPGVALDAVAQEQARIAASTRAATAVCASTSATGRCRITDTSDVTVLIEYGQPHARGREVWGTLVPFDSVWRLGANAATHLITRVPLTIGSAQIPAGNYTLHLLPTAATAQLIVSDSSGTDMWGVPYPGASRDRARIPMRSRNLTENIETLVINLVPGVGSTSSGVLSILWGRREYSVEWTAQLSGRGRGPTGEDGR